MASSPIANRAPDRDETSDDGLNVVEPAAATVLPADVKCREVGV